ncbi:MAG: hypothetical protein H7841_07260 [Magnetospirillum sp. WYHS-4]
MSGTEANTRAVAGMDLQAFNDTCFALVDWLGTVEMPEDRVGIREAGGCLGGILVGLMTEGKATFIPGESGNVAALCGYLKDDADPHRAAILTVIGDCAQAAVAAGRNLEFSLAPKG